MRVKRFLGMVLAAGVLAGCEDLEEFRPGDTYDLVEAEGQPLPAVVFDGDTEFGHVVATAISGSITLRESTYTERIVFDITLDGGPFPGGDEPVVVNGDYSADGGLLTFEPDREDYPTFTGTLSGDVLTTVETDPQFGTLTLVWER
jgi:hypothetical protein